MTMSRLQQIKSELAAEWSKPKTKNVKGKGSAALAIVKKVSRSYKTINALHKERNLLKSEQ